MRRKNIQAMSLRQGMYTFCVFSDTTTELDSPAHTHKLHKLMQHQAQKGFT